MGAMTKAAGVAALLLALAPWGARGAGSEVAFTLSMAALDGGGRETTLAPERRIELPSGSRIRFAVEAATPLCLYLFLDDAEGRFTALRPGAAGARALAASGDALTVPEGRGWFTLDPTPGTETFLLFASREAHPELEALARRAAAPEGLKGAERESALAVLQRLRRAGSGLSEPAEKPVPIAGVTRSAGGASAALPVRAEGLFSRTMRVEHR